ncbi:TetR/AcrR family transcriptional regulator [Paenibacillus sp. FSL E2-0202]|jgi:AcrR family transcriptional regulator|uniref:TetR/AcrR family transcriptional regulator n=1 Tax=unclassified Paenibacillus TaxID=185978 RepID=UPI0030EC55F4
MSDNISELQRLEVLRLSNIESNRITRNCIETALILLMKDKCFKDISITEIVKRAGVSRTAYYRNYNSKEDILRSLMEDIMDKVMDSMELQFPIKNTFKYWNSLFQTLEKHYESISILIRANFDDLILKEINSKARESLTNNAVETYKSYFWIGAIYNVALAWVQDGMKQTVEEMATICLNIVDRLNKETCRTNI